MFLVLGVGFAYAGFGVCITPDPEESVFQTNINYYPSSYLKFVENNHVVNYPDKYCQGAEGTCTTVFGTGSISTILNIEWIEYYDFVDDGIKNQGSYPTITLRIRIVC